MKLRSEMRLLFVAVLWLLACNAYAQHGLEATYDAPSETSATAVTETTATHAEEAVQAEPSPTPKPMESDTANTRWALLESSLQSVPVQMMDKVHSAVNTALESHCHPSVCFVLDGSSTLSDADFRTQQEFVKLVSAIIALDERASFAAVLSDRRVRRVARMTTRADAFLRRVHRVERRCPCDARSNVRRGIRRCGRELRRATGDVQKMVVFGDGDVGAAVARATRRPSLRDERVDVCTVRVGGAGAGGDDVLDVRSWYELLDVIDKLVHSVCDV